nr:unnamed protein product [Naegleria fowleri]
MYSDDDRCTILDNFQHGSNQGVSQSADNKITKELMQTIELYNSVNGSFTHTSPMADGKVILVGDSMVGKTYSFFSCAVCRSQRAVQIMNFVFVDLILHLFDVNFAFGFLLLYFNRWDTAGQEVS